MARPVSEGDAVLADPSSPTATLKEDRTAKRFDLNAALIAASILLPAIFFGVAALQSYRAAMRQAEARVDRTVRMLQEHAVKVFETHRLAIDVVNGRLPSMDWESEGDRAALHALMARLQQSLEQIATITVTDANGRLVASSRSYPVDPSIMLDDRDWFQAVKAADVRPPYVSRSYVGRQSGQVVFNVAGRASGPHAGSFEGAVAVSVDRAYFETFYRTVEPVLDNAIALVRDDGEILARVPTTSKTSVGAGSALLSQGRHASSAVVRVRSTLDGVERLAAFRRIGDEPVFVIFSISLRAIMEAWRDDLLAYGLTSALAAAVLLAVSQLAIRRAEREVAATARWQTAATELRTAVAQRELVEAQLRQSQKMDAVGRLTGGVAHDFNNLLTVVIGSLELLKRRLGEGGAAHARLIASALDGANRAATLTHRLLAFSRQQPLAAEPCDANRLVSGVSDLLQRTLGERYDLECVLAGGLWTTLADHNQLENALVNLAVNARDAMPDGGKLTIETANAHLDAVYAGSHPDVSEGQYVLIAVSDNGSGMPADVVDKAFEPFFTTKPVGQGTGLGLSQVYGFAKQSGGHCTLYSEPGHGTVVKLYLPRLLRASPAASPPLPEVDPPAPGAAGEVVLVVEDDASVRQFGVSVLREAGYDVLEAGEGPAGLAILRSRDDVELLFTDVVLTGPLNGRELAQSARRIRPLLPVLFTTGYTRNAIIHHGRLDDDVDLLVKPFTPELLLRAVRRLLDAAREGQTAASGPE